jgi:hypothetical protein
VRTASAVAHSQKACCRSHVLSLHTAEHTELTMTVRQGIPPCTVDYRQVQPAVAQCVTEFGQLAVQQLTQQLAIGQWPSADRTPRTRRPQVKPPITPHWAQLPQYMAVFAVQSASQWGEQYHALVVVLGHLTYIKTCASMLSFRRLMIDSQSSHAVCPMKARQQLHTAVETKIITIQ